LANAGIAALNSKTPANTAIIDFFNAIPPTNAPRSAHSDSGTLPEFFLQAKV
jgi:hypothetical protein